MRQFIAILVIFCAALLVGAGQASSATEETSLWRPYTDAYAQCMVWRHHDRAAAVILKDVDDETLKYKYGDVYISKPIISMPECDNLHLPPYSEFVLNANELRFSLAKSLVQTDLKGRTDESFASVPPLSHRPAQSIESLARLSGLSALSKRDALSKMQQGDEALMWLAYFGECVVRRDPANTRLWLFSRSRSSEEATILQTLNPSFGACLTDGRTLTFGREVLRGAIAINFYRLAIANSASLRTNR